MKFIRDVFNVLKTTSWPDKKQRRYDFISILEYTAFFVVIVYLFDLAASRGLLALIKLF